MNYYYCHKRVLPGNDDVKLPIMALSRFYCRFGNVAKLNFPMSALWDVLRAKDYWSTQPYVIPSGAG